MVSVEIALKILDEIEKALDLGFDKMYVNVDDLENGYGFLRFLAMQGTKELIVFEGNFDNCNFEGKGKEFHENGKICYEDDFKNGKYEGKGKLYYDNGEIKYEGIFKNGELYEDEQHRRR